VARDSKSKRRQKKLRRAKNAIEKAASLNSTEEARVRTGFHGKARRGDAVGLDVSFSDVSVPYDPNASDPSVGVAERHHAVKAWDKAGNPTKGNA
jgi:hypothetical protein